MRIAFLTDASGLGGAEFNVLEIIRRARGHDLIALSSREGEFLDRVGALGAEAVALGVPAFRSTGRKVLGRHLFDPFASALNIGIFVPAVLRLSRLLRRRQVDVLHTNAMLAHFYGALAGRLAGRPAVMHMEDIVDPRLAGGLALRSLRFCAARLATRVVSVSRAVDSMFEGVVSRDKRAVVYNGVDVDAAQHLPSGARERVRQEFGFGDNDIVVMIVGRIVEWKGHTTLLRAFADAVGNVPSLKLCIVGKAVFGPASYEQELRTLASELRVGERVLFTGYRTDVAACLEAADICVLPSETPDPCPLALLQYLAAGKATVATNHGGPAEIVEQDQTGLLVPPRDATALSTAILRLARDAALRRRLGHAAKAVAREKYAADRFVAEMLEQYTIAVKQCRYHREPDTQPTSVDSKSATTGSRP